MTLSNCDIKLGLVGLVPLDFQDEGLLDFESWSLLGLV